MNVDSSSRIRSGDAWARCSCRTAAGTILDGAVIVMLHFESSVEGSLEGSRRDRVRLRRHAHRATGTPLWRTPLLHELHSTRRQLLVPAASARPGMSPSGAGRDHG